MFSLSSPDFNPSPLHSPRTDQLTVSEPISCSSLPVPEALQDRTWEPLRRGQGILDFGPRRGGPAVRTVLHRDAEGRRPEDTGIRMERPILPQAVYAAHDDSYLVFDLNQTPAQRQGWIAANNRTIWRLNHHFQGRPLRVPSGAWVGAVGGTITFLPARTGLLITSNNFARGGAPHGAGLYLLRPGAPAQRLERGLVQEAALSPNGCRLAYAFKPRLDTGIPEGGPRLVVVDLCGASPGQAAAP